MELWAAGGREMSSGDDMRILVVEDEEDLAGAVAAGLRGRATP